MTNSRRIRKSIPAQLRVMRGKPLCDAYRARVAAAVLAILLTISLYYPGAGSWNLNQDARLQMVKRYVGFFKDNDEGHETAEESSQFVLDTEGCKIPNKRVGYSIDRSAYDPGCGERVVDLKKINETHAQVSLADTKFRNTVEYCNLRHLGYLPEKHNKYKIKYSPDVIKFSTNVTIFKLQSDFIKTECYSTPQHGKKSSRVDWFPVVSKVHRPGASDADVDSSSGVRKWSVLIIGMDTMSRGRMLDTMQRTVSYFRRHLWFDYKGFHKIADNTWPNLMALLTGKKRSTFEKACSKSMNKCNHLLMWSKYREAGYVTAYAEDFVSLPDTFSKGEGYIEPPTDHYMRPLFKMGEYIPKTKSKRVAVCTGTKTSGEQILDYAVDFAQTYKNDPFFGFFWMNSNSHNMGNMPETIDGKLLDAFQRLNSSGVLRNTFVVFLSDHGVRFGSEREPIEAYYEERLPALFVSIPRAFQEEYPNEVEHLLSNRKRLVTPYDLYLTLDDILQRFSQWNYTSTSEACPKCQSLLTPIPSTRTCSEASIEEKWCSCHSVDRMELHDDEGFAAVSAVVAHIQNFSSEVKTKDCTQCAHYTLHSVKRIHYYYNRDKSIKYMVIAFTLSPGYVGYEATVSHVGRKYEIVGQMSIITPHFGKGYCVLNSAVSMYCYCIKGKGKCKN